VASAELSEFVAGRNVRCNILAGIKAGDARKTAEYFDSVVPPFDPANKASVNLAAAGPDGARLRGGTGETRNWIVASAVADGKPGTVVDYIPCMHRPRRGLRVTGIIRDRLAEQRLRKASCLYDADWPNFTTIAAPTE